MEEKRGYLKGIIGAIIGGFIAALPWLLIYVYGEMIYSILTVLIAIGALKGYQILKGKEDKKLPVIIAIISLVVVTVCNLVIAPLLMLGQNDLPMTLENLQLLYKIETFTSALTHDFIMSILFTILGAGCVIANIYKQIKSGKKVTGFAEKVTVSDESIANYREVFEKVGAITKDSAVSKETILDMVSEEYRNDFQLLVNTGVIRKYKGNYYLK